MGVTPGDIQALFRGLEEGDWDEVSLDVAGAKIRIRRRPSQDLREIPPEADAARVAPTSSNSECRKSPDHVRRVVAPVVGRLSWVVDPSALLGRQIDEDTVVARIESCEAKTDITCGKSGAVLAVRPLADGDFVEFGQWLVLIQSR